MSFHRTISVSKVYVPNEYSVYLAPDDRDQFASYENSLLDELRQHLVEHARRERYALLTQPRVLLETDADLSVGEFGIATRMVQPKGGERDERLPAPAGQTMVYRPEPAGVPTQAASLVDLGSTNGLEVNGRRTQRATLSDGDRITIGTTELVFSQEER